MANKVTTLVDASDNTTQLYPRTKASAVTDDNGNALGSVAVYNAQTVLSGVDTVIVAIVIDENTVYETEIDSQHLRMGVDTSNILHNASASSYTATQDCWVFAPIGNTFSNSSVTYVNGQTVNFGGKPKCSYFLRKGQVLTCSNVDNLVVYGLK